MENEKPAEEVVDRVEEPAEEAVEGATDTIPDEETVEVVDAKVADDGSISFEEIAQKGSDILAKAAAAGKEPIENAIKSWARRGLAVLDGVLDGLDPKKPKD